MYQVCMYHARLSREEGLKTSGATGTPPARYTTIRTAHAVRTVVAAGTYYCTTADVCQSSVSVCVLCTLASVPFLSAVDLWSLFYTAVRMMTVHSSYS